MYSPVQYVDRPHHADVTAMTRVVDYDNDNYSKEIVTETVEGMTKWLVNSEDYVLKEKTTQKIFVKC